MPWSPATKGISLRSAVKGKGYSLRINFWVCCKIGAIPSITPLLLQVDSIFSRARNRVRFQCPYRNKLCGLFFFPHFYSNFSIIDPFFSRLALLTHRSKPAASPTRPKTRLGLICAFAQVFPSLQYWVFTGFVFQAGCRAGRSRKGGAYGPFRKKCLAKRTASHDIKQTHS